MFTPALTWAILIGACFPSFYYLLAIAAGLRFFRRPEPAPKPDFEPPVSILKPVRGLDPEAYENFSSFCRQDYPTYEILFCVSEPNDPAVPVIEKVIRDFPERSIRLLVGAEELGPSGKVNKLCRLAREAKHDVFVISDADVRVAPGFLRRVVAPLADSTVGAVTCLYVGITAPLLGAELEELGTTGDFFPGVLVAERLQGVKFALGAAIATTRERVQEIGGFEALVDCFVDDYELGHRIAARGHRVALSRSIVHTMYPAVTWREFFAHQMRWLLAVRTARPWGHAGLLFTHGLPWALAAAAVAPSAGIALGYLGAYLVLRVTMAMVVGVWGMKDPLMRRKWWLLPLRDAIWFFVWLASFFQSRIRWRGSVYRLRDGRLIPID